MSPGFRSGQPIWQVLADAMKMGHAEEGQLLDAMAWLMMIIGAVLFGLLLFFPVPYGKFTSRSFSVGPAVNARIGWFFMACPAFLISFTCLTYLVRNLHAHFYVAGWTLKPRLNAASGSASVSDVHLNSDVSISWTCVVPLSMFCLHYFQRCIIYPLLMGHARPMPIMALLAGLMFMFYNGYLQGRHHLTTVSAIASLVRPSLDGAAASYSEPPNAEAAAFLALRPPQWLADLTGALAEARPTWALPVGIIVELIGMAINVHSDHILRSLRRQGLQTAHLSVAYRPPSGGFFQLVSSANYFGEIVEWTGYAMASWSLPAFAFALFTAANLVPRAKFHHLFYLQKFDDYPRNRKAVIPFIY